MSGRIFNGRDRAATEELFGFALYEGTIEDGEFNGRHVGIMSEGRTTGGAE